MIDAALSADAAALAHGEAGTTIVIVGPPPAASCPALARVAADTYVATLGDSTIEHGLGPRWSRARDYLATAPIALAADLGNRHVLAAAEQGTAWLAIDGADAEVAQRELTTAIARWRSLGKKLAVTRNGTQVIVRATALDPDQLATLAHDVLAQLDPIPAACRTRLRTGARSVDARRTDPAGQRARRPRGRERQRDRRPAQGAAVVARSAAISCSGSTRIA